MWYNFKAENELRKIAHYCSGAGFSLPALKDLLSLYGLATELFELAKKENFKAHDAALMVFAGMIIEDIKRFKEKHDIEGLEGANRVKFKFYDMMFEKDYWYEKKHVEFVTQLVASKTS